MEGRIGWGVVSQLVLNPKGALQAETPTLVIVRTRA